MISTYRRIPGGAEPFFTRNSAEVVEVHFVNDDAIERGLAVMGDESDEGSARGGVRCNCH